MKKTFFLFGRLALVMTALVFLIGSLPAAHAAPAIAVINLQAHGWSNYTIGWQFMPTTDISVTHLGYYQTGFPEKTLKDNHEVGIYNSSGTLVVSATVTTTTPIREGRFRYVAVTPTFLDANQTYYAAGLSVSGDGDDDDPYMVKSIYTTAPEISYLATTHDSTNNSGVLTFPGTATSVPIPGEEHTDTKFYPISYLQPRSQSPEPSGYLAPVLSVCL